MINTNQKTVGIDDIALYVPKLFISALGEFAAARNIEPAKLSRGIGVEKMAVPDAHEDAATMAAMSVLELMKRNHLKPEQIGRIYLGTESGVDESKAMGTYVIGMLEKVYGKGAFQECSTVEFKSACIGATHALENVSYWLQSLDDEEYVGDENGVKGDDSGKENGVGMVGIVVASDIARYELNSPGEYTQGAGSISMLIKRNPRFLAFDSNFGVCTRDENDFFRPIGMTFAIVNGKYSNYCYLSAMQDAFESYRRRTLNRGTISLNEGECLTDHLSHMVFHIPYPRMAEYAASAIFRLEWRDAPRWQAISEAVGDEPLPEMFQSLDEYLSADNQFRRKFTNTDEFQLAFLQKVKPSTLISSQVGNIYTGSIYLGLTSLLEQSLLHPGQWVGFGSYGSGCTAMFFSGVVQPGIKSLASINVFNRLKKRTEISLDDYQLLHEGQKMTSIISPSDEFVLLKVGQDGYRHYDFVS